MTLQCVSTTEQDSLHYRLVGDTSHEVAERITKLRGEAALAGGRCASTGPHLSPDGKYRSAVWIDPQH